MIKFIMCCTRNHEMTREQFLKYWQHSHAPLFNSFAESYGTKKYIQCHTIDTPLNQGIRESRGMQQEFDGVAEVWFESEHALIEAMSSPEGQKISAILKDDESTFIDHSKSTAFIAREVEF